MEIMREFVHPSKANHVHYPVWQERTQLSRLPKKLRPNLMEFKEFRVELR